MAARITSFRLLGNLAPVIVALLGVILSEMARATPAPKSQVYALVYIPKKSNQQDSIRNRRSQIASIKSRFTLYAAIRSLKEVDLSLVPKKGKGKGVEDDHEDDVAWLAQHLQIEYLDGTGVLRIALDAGTPREQALLVNAVVDAYFKLEARSKQEQLEKGLEHLQQQLKVIKRSLETVKGEKKQKLERHSDQVQETIKRDKEKINTLPRVLELADVPPK